MVLNLSDGKSQRGLDVGKTKFQVLDTNRNPAWQMSTVYVSIALPTRLRRGLQTPLSRDILIYFAHF